MKVMPVDCQHHDILEFDFGVNDIHVHFLYGNWTELFYFNLH